MLSRTPEKRLSGIASTSRIDISVERFPATSRALHWVIAALVLMIWPLGMVIQFVKGDVSLTFYMIHESLGFLVLWLMLLRVGNKLLARSPPPLGTKLEKKAASAVHGLLYLFLIVMPVSGFLATNAYGFPLVWFDVLPVWSPIGKAPGMAGVFSAVHFWSSWALFVLFGLHFAAALMHHVIKRDQTLYRML